MGKVAFEQADNRRVLFCCGLLCGNTPRVRHRPAADDNEHETAFFNRGGEQAERQKAEPNPVKHDKQTGWELEVEK